MTNNERILKQIKMLAMELPAGMRNTIYNRCEKMARVERKGREWKGDNEQTREQVADSCNAQKAIFAAMCAGRRISIKHSREFRIAEMHTAVVKIRQRIEANSLPWEMCSEWVADANGRRFKEYWLVPVGEGREQTLFD